jgi:hypothetical protein
MISEFRDLAAEIQLSTGLDFDAAYRLAWEQMPELLNEVMMDVRYIPRRVVMLDQLMTAEELEAMTRR